MNGVVTAAYRDQTRALLTQHGKEHVIGPVLEAAFGCRVQLVTVNVRSEADPGRCDYCNP